MRGLYIKFLRINLVLIFVGDGNCEYHEVSLALFSTQEYHAYVRFMTALESWSTLGAMMLISPSSVCAIRAYTLHVMQTFTHFSACPT